MFCKCCRSNSKKTKEKGPIRQMPKNHTDYQSNVRIQSANIYDKRIVTILNKDLADTPEWFVLNNMLMSIHFFKNYQRDVLKPSKTLATKSEMELNLDLLKNERMECTSPDVVFDKVAKNVRFRPLHGPRKHSSETLAAKRLFVINDMIEVVSTMDVAQYTSIDKPAYQVKVEESPRRGFVRLKFIDSNKIPKIYETPPNLEPSPGTSRDSDSDNYDYMSITDLRTPKPLEIMSDLRRDTLPRTCFASRRQRKNLTDWLIENEDQDVELTDEDMFETVTYVNAKGFMNYFKNGLFPNSLGKSLGFDEFEIRNRAINIPGKVFANLYDAEENPIPCEVIPSVAIEWPGEQAFEFIMREERPTITDRQTGFRYRWPTDEMIKDIQSLSCVLIPTGYWPKKGKDINAEIEWQIAFPKAERYIESCMSHSQMRCFLFLLALHKTFIEPETKQHGLLTEHIRCHMYWECERDYRDWPEHRLGFKIKKVIINLIGCLTRRKMPDYFIKSKNLFENIASRYLLYAQELFHKVLESPLMYFLVALRNVRYTNGKFYPPLDFKELYKMLIQTQGIKIVNPTLLKAVPPNLKHKRYEDDVTQWNHIRYLKNKEKYLKLKYQDKENENVVRKEERRDSKESVNLEWNCEKHFDVYKIKALLNLFINHFIDIAKDSSRISTKDQALFFLKQALYLTNILEDTSPAFIVEADEFKQTIFDEEIKIKKEAAKEISDLPPATPVRNSMQPFDYSQLKNNQMSYGRAAGSKILRSTSTMIHGSPNARIKNFDRFSSGETVTTYRKSISFVEPPRN